MKHLTTSLRDRLKAALPGAVMRVDLHAPALERHVVEGWREHRGEWVLATLATGSTEREAVDRALFLFARQR